MFNLQAAPNPNLRLLPIRPEVTVGQLGEQFLFGGVALAAAIAALEKVCDRPLIYATAQFLSFGRLSSALELEPRILVLGNRISQASISRTINARPVLIVQAAVGAGPDIDHQFEVMPDVPAPERCPMVENPHDANSGLHKRFERRLAAGTFGDRLIDGNHRDGLQLWVRSVKGLRPGPQMLAVIADFAFLAIRGAIHRPAGGNSLDNSIRFTHREPTDWMLCDARIEAVADGIVHSRMRIFSETGNLLASAAQSMVLRPHNASQRRTRTRMSARGSEGKVMMLLAIRKS